MSICFEKARELAGLLQESEKGIVLGIAKQALAENAEICHMLEEFKLYQQSTQESMSSGTLSQAEYDELAKEIAGKTKNLKDNPIISNVINAENEFYAFVNQVLGIIKATLSGEIDEGGHNCGKCRSDKSDSNKSCDSENCGCNH